MLPVMRRTRSVVAIACAETNRRSLSVGSLAGVAMAWVAPGGTFFVVGGQRQWAWGSHVDTVGPPGPRAAAPAKN